MEKASSKEKRPWVGRPSLYEYVQVHLNDEGTVGFEDWHMPDRVYAKDSNEYETYTPGSDDFMEASRAGEVAPEFIKLVADTLQRYSKKGKINDKILLYNIIKEDHVIAYWDELSEELEKRRVSIQPYLLELARWLVREAPDRGAVKFGIAMLGCCRDGEAVPFLKVIGMHDEFSYFVADALQNITPTWDLIVMEMAKKLLWFGRYQCVYALCSNSDRKEVKYWVVREGYHRFYLPNFLILLCAKYGELADELSQKDWYKDKRLVTTVRVTILDLAHEFRDSCSSEYRFGGDVIEAYLKYAIGRLKSMIHYCILVKLQVLLDKAMADHEICDALGMTEERCSDFWIDVSRELRQSWCQRQQEKLDPRSDNRENWSVEDRCRYLYDRLCYD